jgi:hypothetical protein
MRRLVWIHVGRKPTVGFVMMQLIYSFVFFKKRSRNWISFPHFRKEKITIYIVGYDTARFKKV